jgi:hypothetical protein
MDPEEYRAKAAACLLVAKRVKDPNIRTRWVAMARAWNQLLMRLSGLQFMRS